MNAFWAEVEQKLTPVLVTKKPATTSAAAIHDVAFLHTLSTTHANVKLERKLFTLPACWMIYEDGGAYTGETESLLKISNNFPNLSKDLYEIQSITLTKSGEYFVVVVLYTIYILSFYGNIVRCFQHNSMIRFAAVDITGHIWSYNIRNKQMLCFTEDLKLIGAIQLTTIVPTAIACHPNGRILIASRNCIYSISPSDGTDESLIIDASYHGDTHIQDMKVCNRTGNIYLLNNQGVLGFLPSGKKQIHGFKFNIHNQWSTSLALSPDGYHIMISNFNWCRIAVWTHEGKFVCEWSFENNNPKEVIFLPHDRVAMCTNNSIEVFIPKKIT